MDHKSYYAVIPANVRYCQTIANGAKLLYGEITALCNETGYCWASNKYFSDLYGASERTISRWISELARAGFLLTIVDTAEGNSRKIWLRETQGGIDKNVHRVTTKMSGGSRQKRWEGIDKNVLSYKENNTVNNTGEVVNGKTTTTTTENGTSPVEAEKEKKAPPIAAAPPHAGGPAVDVAAELERLRADQSARENFTLTRKIPAANFDAYVTAFSREVAATAPIYWKVSDLRRHFFNWSGIRYDIECKNQHKPGASPAPGRPRDMVQL